ncbi:MAG: diguanylate cyclase domain-containing protein [Burkholderiaceae bacterium]
MTLSLDSLRLWFAPNDPDLLEQRVLALAETKMRSFALVIGLTLLISALVIGKLPVAWLIGAGLITIALAGASAAILHRHRSGAKADSAQFKQTERLVAVVGFFVACYLGWLIASPGTLSLDRQVALIMLGLLTPLALVRTLGASRLVFIAAAAPVLIGSGWATYHLGSNIQPYLLIGFAAAVLLMIEHTLLVVNSIDQAMRAKSRERSLLSQQLALFSTSQLGIAQTVNGKIGRANARFRQWFGEEGSGEALLVDLAASIGLNKERLLRLINRADARIVAHESRNINILLNGATPRYFSVQVRRFDPTNQTRGLLWTVSDQTSDWLSRKASERAATRDPLTGALNRRALHKRLSTMLMRDLRRQPFAVLCVDINRFGELNNANGQGFGDQILCIVTRRVQRMLREQDVIARTGGNEFVLVLENVNGMERATVIAEKVMETLSAPIVLTSMTCSIAAAVGVAVAPAHGRRTDEILSRARASMFAVKRTLVQVQAGQMGRRSP